MLRIRSAYKRPLLPVRSDSQSFRPGQLFILQQRAIAATPVYVMRRAGAEIDNRLAFCETDGKGHYKLLIVAPICDPNANIIRLSDMISLSDLDIHEAGIFLRDCDALFRKTWNACRLKNGFEQIEERPPLRSYTRLPKPPPGFTDSEIIDHVATRRLAAARLQLYQGQSPR